VTYGRAVVVVDVLSETELPHTPEVDKNGEGYVGRSVSLRVVRELWTPPDAEPAPAQFETIDWGWLLKNGKLLPFNQSRLEVGHRYLVPLVEIDGKFGSLAMDAIPVDGDAMGTSNLAANTWETAELAGLSLDTVAQRLAATSIDPVAASFMDLPPVERAEAVRTAKGQPRLTND
jgi:hypothetical protein